MTFVPAVTPPTISSARPLCFVVQPSSGLVVREEGGGVRLPERGDLGRLGLRPEDAHYLGRLDEEDCFALEAAPGEPSGPWQVRGLRSLYGQLGDEEFAVAGRAVQIATF